MAVQSRRQRWHVSQGHLAKPLVEQAEVSQENRADGGAIVGRVPTNTDRSSFLFASGLSWGCRKEEPPPVIFG